jgi:hypothetical protein
MDPDRENSSRLIDKPLNYYIISKHSLLLLKSIYNIMVRNKINYDMKYNSGKPIE